MIQVQGVSKQYGSKVLFENADAYIGDRSRIALIGPNGAGKSTLIRLLLGLETPDSGKMVRSRHLKFGYLAQEVPKFEAGTVFSEVMKLGDRVEKLQQTKNTLEDSFSKGLEDAKALEEYGRILTELERFDEARLEARAKEVLMGMGFRSSDFSRSLSEFSGGWLMRVAFSRVLLQEPDLLLLDEPTNHLDLESLLWLENFLKVYPGAILLISHDTAFLNALVEEVLEIDQKKIYQYRGNVSAYSIQKNARIEYLRAQYENQQAKIEQMEEFIARNRAKSSRAGQAQSRVKQIEKMEKIELPEERSTIRFRFPPIPQGGKEVISLKNVKVHFGEKRIFEKLNWTIQRGARVAITGVNGAGKTTLLRLLSGELEPNEGEVKPGHNLKIGYYAQHQAETLGLRKTIFEELQDTAPHLTISQIRAIAGAFLFTGDAVEKKCAVLSGGEKARVALAKLLLSPANFLILDEPTNHLDADSREVLLEALKDYPGTVCLVSHDRDFISPLVSSVLEIQPSASVGKSSQAVQLLGSYEDYLKKKLAEISVQNESHRGISKNEILLNHSSKNSNHREKKLREKRQLSLEEEIHRLEEQKNEIDRRMSEESTLIDTHEMMRLLKRRQEIENLLPQKEKEWEESFMSV